MTDDALNLLLSDPERHTNDDSEPLRMQRDAASPDRHSRERFANHLVTVNRLANVAGFAADIAHEINNVGMLLSGAIMGIEDALREGHPPEEESVRDLHRAFDLIVEHTRRLGELGRVPSSHTELADLRPVIADTLGLLRATGRTKYVKVDLSLPGEPICMRINRPSVEQLLIDLVTNATDAVSVGDGSAHAIRVALERREGNIALSVEDDGPGISPEVASHLFEPFVTSKAPGRATGLGLTAARQLAENLGGTLRFEAGRSQGARFVFEVKEPAPRVKAA